MKYLLVCLLIFLVVSFGFYFFKIRPTTYEYRLNNTIAEINVLMPKIERPNPQVIYKKYTYGPARLPTEYRQSIFLNGDVASTTLDFGSTKLNVLSVNIKHASYVELIINANLNGGEVRMMRMYCISEDLKSGVCEDGGNKPIQGRSWEVVRSSEPACEKITRFTEFFLPYSIDFDVSTGQLASIEVAQFVSRFDDSNGCITLN